MRRSLTKEMKIRLKAQKRLLVRLRRHLLLRRRQSQSQITKVVPKVVKVQPLAQMQRLVLL